MLFQRADSSRLVQLVRSTLRTTFLYRYSFIETELESLETHPIAQAEASVEKIPTTYFSLSRTRSYGFLAALPLIILYEVMIFLANDGSYQQVRVGAEVWIKDALALFGQAGLLVMGVGIILVGAVILFVDRKKGIEIRPTYFGGIILESTVYAIVVALLVSTVVGVIFAAAVTEYAAAIVSVPPGNGLFTDVALSIGAGIYEELIFRVLLVGGATWALSLIGLERVTSYVIAAIIGAAIFSAVHYIGSLGDVFTIQSFTFRFLFGLVLNVIFLVRGFGVAAWTHAIYDIMIVTGMFG